MRVPSDKFSREGVCDLEEHREWVKLVSLANTLGGGEGGEKESKKKKGRPKTQEGKREEDSGGDRMIGEWLQLNAKRTKVIKFLERRYRMKVTK